MSVSYTHLDVYKRQTYEQGNVVKEIGYEVDTTDENDPFKDATDDKINSIKIRVSDVYKRQVYRCTNFNNQSRHGKFI